MSLYDNIIEALEPALQEARSKTQHALAALNSNASADDPDWIRIASQMENLESNPSPESCSLMKDLIGSARKADRSGTPEDVFKKRVLYVILSESRSPRKAALWADVLSLLSLNGIFLSEYPDDEDGRRLALCPQCGMEAWNVGSLDLLFGIRRPKRGGTIPQSWCRSCRSNKRSPSGGEENA